MKIQLILLCCLMSFNAKAAADKTELQWTLCEKSVESFLTKMQIRIDERSAYQISYFDSKDLQLLAHRVFLRQEVKESEKTKPHSKLKVEFNQVNDVDGKWMDKHQAKCEYDRYGSWQKVRCSLQNKISSGEATLNDDQMAMLQKYRPDFALPALVEWGPYQGQNFTFTDERGSLDYSADETDVNGTLLLELSLRVDTVDADKSYQKLTQQLVQHQVQLCPQQVGKFERLLALP